MERALEDSSVRPLAHLASSTVRTFELVYSGRKTEVLLSAGMVEDMREYASLLNLAHGSLMLERAELRPAFL